MGCDDFLTWERYCKFTSADDAAHEMKARGLGVEVNVFIDEVAYAVDAAIEITNPARSERGAVHVTDDGAICWECDFDELTGQAAEIADTIADTLTLCG
jgi:hypothetical protein